MIATERPRHPRYFFGYIRESILDDSEDLSRAAQEEQLRDYYNTHLLPLGVEFGGIVCEVGEESFKKGLWYRPVGQEVLRCIRPGDHFVTRAERAFSGARDLIWICRDFAYRDIRLVLLDMPSTDGYQFTLEVFGFLAKWESSNRAENAIAARQLAKQHQGAYPLSWGGRWRERKGKARFVPFELELFLIFKAVKWREEGLSLDATNDRIHRLICTIEGEEYRQGKPISVGGRIWSADTVRDAVKEYSTNEELRAVVDVCGGLEAAFCTLPAS